MSILVFFVHVDTCPISFHRSHTHTDTHPDKVLQSLASSLSDGPWQVVVRMGSKPRGHRRHPSARLLSGYYSQTYALIEPSSSPHTPTLTHTLAYDVHVQTPTYTLAHTSADKAGAEEVWDYHCDEWNTLMMDGCLAGSWQHSYIRQRFVNK